MAYVLYCDFFEKYYSELADTDLENCGFANYDTDIDYPCYDCPYCTELDQSGCSIHSE